MKFKNGERYYKVGCGIEEMYYIGKNPIMSNYHIFCDKNGENIKSYHEEYIMKNLYRNVNEAIEDRIVSEEENNSEMKDMEGESIRSISLKWYNYQKKVYKIE